MTRKVLWWLCIFIVAAFIFFAGAGSAKSVWGGVLALIIVAAVWGLIELGP